MVVVTEEPSDLSLSPSSSSSRRAGAHGSLQEREELAYRLLTSLPRSRLAEIQRKIAPLLQFDLVGSLPAELALQIFSYFSSQTLLACALVCCRWRALADDQSLWKNLCQIRGWEWRQPCRGHASVAYQVAVGDLLDDEEDDEGMGDEEEDSMDLSSADEGVAGSLFMAVDDPETPPGSPSTNASHAALVAPEHRIRAHTRHSAPSVLPSLTPRNLLKSDYKLLYLTHTRLHARFLSASYRLSALQTRGGPTNAHRSTIYCLHLYTHPRTGVQTLFTGSKDRTIREWNLKTGAVERIIDGVHDSSVLSICVADGYIASAGSDRRVAVWELESNKLIGVINDHEDSVLCVRFTQDILVSCSKDRTVRTYGFPDLTPQLVLSAHRAAVNAVSISQDVIVSGSGDRSIRLWDAHTGALLHTYENHHIRGIASIDFKPPYILSGSSDKHVRFFDMTSQKGWSTSPLPFFPDTMCPSCGNAMNGPAGYNLQVGHRARAHCTHGDLVRSVALGDDFVVSGSYDLSLKVWDRKTGALIADLTGGHTGRIFCIAFDCTKIVSCGEDQRICVWDFSHGIDTSFIKL